MNMKKFVKKPLAIAVLMLASGGMVNMVHAEPTVINSKDISATKTVKEGGSFSVEFKATENEIVSGKLDADTPAFHLVMSDSGEHKGWNVRPTGASEGGQMVSTDGTRVDLHTNELSWDNDHWWIDDGSERVEATFFLAAGDEVKAGEYQFTGRVEEYVE
ncbi:TPA: fimbrial polyadhesin major subunit MyfA [Yersinia enterocolitica]